VSSPYLTTDAGASRPLLRRARARRRRSLRQTAAVDINRAAPEELARLPGVGVGLAARIVEHRARYGAFRRAEHLLMVRGIGERRFERLRPYITVE
jgi:competence protein ComEA